MFLLVSFYGFPWKYQVANRDETRLNLPGDYKGFGPPSEECAKSSYFCSNLALFHI